MSGVATAIVGSAVIGAYASNKAASKSAKAQKKGIDASNALLQPFSDAGAAGLGGVQDFVDQGANFSDTQAFKDIINSQKARGQNLSGNTLTGLSSYYANNFRPQRLNELLALPTIGANASARQATNIGNQYTNLGNTQAAGALGVGNSISSGVNQLGFLGLYNQNQGLNQPSATLQPGSFTIT